MFKTDKRALSLIIFLLAVLILTNPTERSYLNTIAKQYGLNHGGMKLNVQDLKKLGTGERTSYLLFSTYTYRYANANISYVGIAAFIFKTNSYAGYKKNREDKTRTWGT